MYRVTHLTSVHRRNDPRIFLKECTSLAKAGYAVSLIVADGEFDQEINGVSIYDVGSPKGRLDRIKSISKQILLKAVALNSDIYHIHDPELLPLGMKLRRYGKVVVFDSHEDVPKQILSKPYLGKVSRSLVSYAYSVYEKYSCKRVSGVIAATPFIREKFSAMGVRCEDVNNYPLLEELSSGSSEYPVKSKQVAYVGSLSRVRGIHEMVQAVALSKSGAKLTLGGTFTDRGFENLLASDPGWENVEFRGWMNRKDVKQVLNESVAGLVTLQPTVNHVDSLPVKMFEYMCAGLPVIASNFPLWKKIIEPYHCGICVDPLKPEEIANAIDYLIAHPAVAQEMGANGRRAVEECFNWYVEEEKLLSFYSSLL